MKKYPFILMCILLAFGSVGCGNDDIEYDSITRNDSFKPDVPNLFIGKWKIKSIEDSGTVTDYTDDNSTVSFYEDGRFAYTPFIDKGIEGEVYGIYESSESLLNINYSYKDKELYIHRITGGVIDIYTYDFSDDKDTLRIVLSKSEQDGTIVYVWEGFPSPMLGKTQVLIKLSD